MFIFVRMQNVIGLYQHNKAEFPLAAVYLFIYNNLFDLIDKTDRLFERHYYRPIYWKLHLY